MAERYSAFSFVDRITELEPGKRARGQFWVPQSLAHFPSCLVAEAVGQLAAWVAMAQLEFRKRPVAGLAGEASFLGKVNPGQTLDLTVEIETCDDDAIAYNGSARVDGALVLELKRCVGPMLPIEDFDAPEALREQFELLRGAGAKAGRFQGTPEPDLAVVERSSGQWLRAELRVPESAMFFRDHFPRRAVFPATLLLDSQIRLALGLAGETAHWPPGTRPVPSRVTNVKMRAFILPGQVVEIRTEIQSATSDAATVAVAARVNGKSVSTGRVQVVARGAA